MGQEEVLCNEGQRRKVFKKQEVDSDTIAEKYTKKQMGMLGLAMRKSCSFDI